MPNIATLLRDEVARIARKQLRTETEALKKVVGRYRSEIAELKRRLAEVEKQLARAEPRGQGRAAAASVEDEGGGTRLRFRAGGLRAHRERLALTAKDMAALLDVSVQTLANWETGKTKPRASQMAAIAAVRTLGKRAVRERLAAAATAAAGDAEAG